MTRLGVKVLPVVLIYLGGVESARIVGFEKLAYDLQTDDFTIESLEKFLLENGELQNLIKWQFYTNS